MNKNHASPDYKESSEMHDMLPAVVFNIVKVIQGVFLFLLADRHGGLITDCGLI